MSTQKSKFAIMKNELIHLPVGVMATLLGSITLANVFGLLGINSLKHIVVNFGLIIILAGFAKLFLYPKKVSEELKATVGASVYPTMGMAMMLMGAYYVQYNYIFGKTIWLLGVIVDVLVLIFFVYNNIIKKFDFKQFLPSCFVPFVGPIVATISGSAMNAPGITTTIFYFSCIAYFILLPILTYRLFKYPVADNVYPIVCIMAAPPSLCIMAYTTLFKNPNIYFTLFLYAIIVIMTIYMYSRFPKIFSLKFLPSFAGITFPLAISTLATFKVSSILGGLGYETYSLFLKNVGGIQIVIACAGICFVIYNFGKMFFGIFKETTN